jgi:hypothetical protein
MCAYKLAHRRISGSTAIWSGKIRSHNNCPCRVCKKVAQRKFGRWSEFKSCVNHMVSTSKKSIFEREWIFRGISTNMCLETTIERIAKNWGIQLTSLPTIEHELIREFSRKAYDFGIRMPPEKPDTFWWVSLMQHHGAPTRLLDWTFSPYVAAYFALERILGNQKEDAAVWAVQKQWIDQAKKNIDNAKHSHDSIDKSELNSVDFLFDGQETKDPYILQVNSLYLHERLAVQQGVFLCPADVTKSFMDNFSGLSDWQNPEKVVKLIIPRHCLEEAMWDLQKMNITRTSLFPDLDGFAGSLRTRFPFFRDLAIYRDSQKKQRNQAKISDGKQ